MLLVALFAVIFSHSEGSLFMLFIVSFAVQKLLNLIRSHMLIFVYISFTLGSGSYHIFFIDSFVDEHLDCFHVLAVVNSASVNIGVHVSFFNISYFWLCWVFVAVCGLSVGMVSGSCSSVAVCGCLVAVAFLAVAHRLQGTGASVDVARGFSCPVACGVFPH